MTSVCRPRRTLLRRQRNIAQWGMLTSRRQNLREKRDSHYCGMSGVMPAQSRSDPSPRRENLMNHRKPTYSRNSLDLRDKVQVKFLRKRLRLSDEQFTSVVRKSGSSI